MPHGFNRSDRVAGQLRRELALLIQSELKDPDVGFISVSDVEVSRDLAHARVYVTVFDPAAAPVTLRALRRAAGFLRSRLGQQLRIRNMPELHFVHDASVETGQRIDELIATAVASDARTVAGEDTEGDAAPREPDPTP
jgi:ribosome-binding factor A